MHTFSVCNFFNTTEINLTVPLTHKIEVLDLLNAAEAVDVKTKKQKFTTRAGIVKFVGRSSRIYFPHSIKSGAG